MATQNECFKMLFYNFFQSGKGSHILDLFWTLNGDPIPYNPKSIPGHHV